MPFIGNQPALSYTSFAKQDFTTSATTSYTLDNPVANENELALFINFVRQEPTTAYTASGTSLTLTSATSASDDMYCVYLGKAVQTVNPPNGSVGASQIADSSIALGKLSATGTKDSTTFLRGDNTFASAGETNTPYFLATLSGDQDIGYTGVWTKISMANEIHDSAGAYDHTTNYRFTPQTAGKYWVHCQLQFEATAGSDQTPDFRSAIYKNGATTGQYVIEGSANFRQHTPFFGRILDMNGSTDYIECYAQANNTGSGSNRIAAGIASSSFGAYFIAT